MIELVPGSIASVSYVFSNMREVDRREILCLLPDEITAGQFAAGAMLHSPVVAMLKGNPVAVYYLSPVSVSVAFVSMFGTPLMLRAVPAMTRAILELEIPNWHANGFLRFEARSHIDHAQAHSWLENCGAVREGILKSMGKHGEDFVMYALIP